jgi:hypothetical protein
MYRIERNITVEFVQKITGLDLKTIKKLKPQKNGELLKQTPHPSYQTTLILEI